MSLVAESEQGNLTIPLSILTQFSKKVEREKGVQLSLQELERVWEAYKSLLLDRAIEEIEKEEDSLIGANSPSVSASSNLKRMISIKKLYAQGTTFLNAEELTAISEGKLRPYLNQFLPVSDLQEQCESNTD